MQLAFECIFYILINLYIDKNKKESYINSFIKNNKSKLNSILQLNDLDIDNIDFLNLQIDEKLKYKITELYLTDNKLNDSFSNDDNSLSLIPELQYLVLENNNITKFPTSILKLKQLFKDVPENVFTRGVPNCQRDLPETEHRKLNI